MAGVGGRQAALGLEPRDCTVCGTRFQPYRANYETCSKRCYRKLPRVIEGVRAYRAQAHIRERKNALRRVGTNPDRRRVNLRNQLRGYGISLDQFEAMLSEQDGKCALCGAEPNPDGIKAASRLHVDHDHVTGKVRRLLCNGCNRGIGYLRDDPALLRIAAEYIERHRGVNVDVPPLGADLRSGDASG